MRKKDYVIAFTLGVIIAFFMTLRLSAGNLAISGIEIRPLYLFMLFPLGAPIGYAVATILFRRLTVLKQFTRFALIGASNFSIDLGLLSYLTNITGFISGWQVIPLNTIASGTAIANSFFWNRTWTFDAARAHQRHEVLAFVFISVMGLILNNASVYVVVTFFAPAAGLHPESAIDLSKVIATILVLAWNFFGYKFVVFRETLSV